MGSKGKIEMIRCRVFYEGRVQGVGFRATTSELAQQHAVAGWVRNLSDGRVELVTDGEPSVIDEFLAAIDRRLGRWIRDIQVSREPAPEIEQVGFSIRYD
ncbi:MAG: acylphosphatase [Isosphaeraceae bacterium]